MTDLPETSAPASRALGRAGIRHLEDLTRFTVIEIHTLHGMGPKALGILREAMQENGFQFKEKPK